MARRLTPLALTVLRMLLAEPMHQHEMRQRIREYGLDRAIKVTKMSLRAEMDRLVKRGFAEVVDADERRPDRSVYDLTRKGRDTARTHLVRTPDAYLYGQRRRVRPERQPGRAAAKVGWRFRRQLAPFLMLAGVYAAGIFLTALHPGALLVASVGLASTAVWWFIASRAGWLTNGSQRMYAATCAAAASLWLAATRAGGLGPPMPGLLAAAGGALAMPWWWRHRIRGSQAPDPEPDPDSGDEPELIRDWRDKVASDDGPLPKSTLDRVEPIPGGWSGTGTLHRGNVDRAIQATKDIGAALDLRAGSITIEPTADGSLKRFRVLVQPDNPLQQIHYWPGPTLDVETGNSRIGVYSDGEPVPYRHYRPRSGPVHTLIAGSTDAGKSVLVKQLLAEERHSGVIASVLIDPQRGQSYSESGWRRAVARFAGTIPEARQLLIELRDRMYARNELMSSIRWVSEEDGEEIEGVEEFTPGDPRHGLPMISVTIDEAQTVLADDRCRSLVEEMIAMSRKCGIKFRLITQVPLLGSLGNSTPIRDAVAAGNVIVFRTANRLSGQVAFNGTMPVDPVTLPKQWPDGSTTSGLGYIWGPGADRPATMRTFLILKPRQWATTGTPAELEPYRGPVAGGDGAAQAGPNPAAAGQGASEAEQRTGEDAVLAYLAARHRDEVNRGEMIAHIQADVTPAPALRTITLALTELTRTGHVERTGRGLYAITAAGLARLRDKEPAA